MYAVIETGGKQYRVEKGDIVDVELIKSDKGGQVEFTQVLMTHDGKSAKIGAPTVEKSVVKGEVLGAVKGPKEISYKYKKRKNYRRKVGHRQDYTRVKITEIVA